MALHGLVLLTLVFPCGLLPFCVFAGIDGSATISRRCECDSVELWIPRRTNGVSHLLSYEEIVSNTPNDLLLSTNDLDRGLRLWMPKHCDLKLTDDASILQRDAAGIGSQNNAKKIVEVWIKGNPSVNCMVATLKCKHKTLCIGIGTLNEAQSAGRKLLMSKTNNSEETFAHQPYSVLLSVLVFCSIIVLVALCGKVEKNSRECVARDTDGDVVKIVSSEKVQSMKRTDKDNGEGGEVIEIKVEDSGNMATDSNSNNSKQLLRDVDLSLVAVTGDEVQKDAGKSNVDGGVFGKVESAESVGETSNEQGKAMEGRDNEGDRNDRQNEKVKMEKGNNLGRKTDRENEVHDGKKEKRKEEKRKEKEYKHKEKDVRSKDRDKDMRSKRAHTSPESAQPKSSIPKMRFSLKGSSSSSNAYEEPKIAKRDKTKSKKKHDSQSANARAPFTANRHSFVNRELPKRPSEERDNPPGFDDSDDEHYEHVVVQGGPPRNPVKLKIPSQNYDNDSDLYDSVDDSKETKPQIGAALGAGTDQDTYEVVDTKSSKHLAPSAKIIGKRDTPNRGAYECLSGDVFYEDPGMSRQRSFSDALPGSSNPTPEAKRKTMSLGRENGRENAPTPPPLEHIQQAKQSHRIMDDIEPYTITYRKGDLILQETSSSDRVKPTEHREEQLKTPEEMEKLYTEVDKEKQTKDRLENAPNPPQLIIDDIDPYTITYRKGDQILQETSSSDHVKPTEHREQQLKTPEEMETLYTKVDRQKQKKDRLEAEKERETEKIKQSEVNGDGEATVSLSAVSVEEHQYETMPRKKADSEITTLQKKDSFDETEDVRHYEEVDTKKDKPEERTKVFV